MTVPSSWSRMSFYAKMAYLVNTHQALDFRDARSKLVPPKILNGKGYVRLMRLPYADN